MKSIAIFGKYYHPFSGGIEANTKDVAEGLAQKYSVTVYCYNHKKDVLPRIEFINGVKVIRYSPLFTIKSQPISIRIIFDALFIRSSAIHMHAPNVVSSMAVYLNRFFNKKSVLILTHHMDIYGRKTLRALSIGIYKYLTRKADAVICTSLKNAHISNDLDPIAKVEQIPLGIKAADYEVTSAWDKEYVMRGLGLDPNVPCVGFLGRHARYKGLDVLINSIAQLEGVQCLIMGDGPYRNSAEKLVDSLALSGRVKFTGSVSQAQKIDYLNCLTVLAFPSTEITEAFGVSQLEAMSAGIPVVASDLPTGVTDVSVHEVTALLVRPGDSSELAMAIQRLLLDEKLRKALSVNAKKRMATTYSHEKVVENTVELFDRFIDKYGI